MNVIYSENAFRLPVKDLDSFIFIIYSVCSMAYKTYITDMALPAAPETDILSFSALSLFFADIIYFVRSVPYTL
jgi:hypothetical protein